VFLTQLVAHHSAEPTDFWGIVIPTWIAAIGGLATAALAIYATISSIRNRRTSEAISSGLNAQVNAATTTAATEGHAPSDIGYATSTLPERPISWRIQRDGKRYQLINGSRVVAHLQDARDVSDGDDAFQLLIDLPIDIQPGSSLPFTIEKTFASAAVTAIELTWTQGDSGLVHTAVLYV
jgi:hypothetical protein